MSKPYDATTKFLVEGYPADWLALAGLGPVERVALIDSNLSTITAEADTILQVGDPPDYLAHIEIQSGHDLTLPRRLLHYNVLLNYRHDRPVRSVVVILRKEADSPSFNGHHRVLLPDGSCYLDFRYSAIRVWKLDVEMVLRSGLGTLPLAPLTKFNKKDIRSVIDRMKARLDREVPKDEAALLWAATQILMGLRYTAEFSDTILQGVQGMEESATYQAILRKGDARTLIKTRREDLFFIGEKRFGPPDGRIAASIESIGDAERINRMFERSLDVSTWEELLSIL